MQSRFYIICCLSLISLNSFHASLYAHIFTPFYYHYLNRFIRSFEEEHNLEQIPIIALTADISPLPTVHEPSFPSVEEPSIPVSEEPSIPTTEEKSNLVDEEPSVPTAEEPAVPTVEAPSNPVEEPPSAKLSALPLVPPTGGFLACRPGRGKIRGTATLVVAAEKDEVQAKTALAVEAKRREREGHIGGRDEIRGTATLVAKTRKEQGISSRTNGSF